MTALYSFNEAQIMAFILVVIRMSAFTVSWPIFGTQTVPAPVKILFALSLSLVLFPVVNITGLSADMSTSSLIFMTIKEAFIGVSIGYLARMFLYAISISGQIISVTMGLSGVQLFNPSIGETSTPIDQFQVFLVSLLFLAINGHHIFLSALTKSFQMVPLSADLLSLQVFSNVGVMVQQIMVIGVKLAAPVLVAITITNIMMGIIGRAVPQINVLITSLPVNILVGFIVLIFSLPVFMGQVEGLLAVTADNLFKVLKAY